MCSIKCQWDKYFFTCFGGRHLLHRLMLHIFSEPVILCLSAQISEMLVPTFCLLFPLVLESAVNIQQNFFPKNVTFLKKEREKQLCEVLPSGEFLNHLFQEISFPLFQMHNLSPLLRKGKRAAIKEHSCMDLCHLSISSYPLVFTSSS